MYQQPTQRSLCKNPSLQRGDSTTKQYQAQSNFQPKLNRKLRRKSRKPVERFSTAARSYERGANKVPCTIIVPYNVLTSTVYISPSSTVFCGAIGTTRPRTKCPVLFYPPPSDSRSGSVFDEVDTRTFENQQREGQVGRERHTLFEERGVTIRAREILHEGNADYC